MTQIENVIARLETYPEGSEEREGARLLLEFLSPKQVSEYPDKWIGIVRFNSGNYVYTVRRDLPAIFEWADSLKPAELVAMVAYQPFTSEPGIGEILTDINVGDL